MIFSLISSFLSNRDPWVVLDGKCSQEYPVYAGVPQGFMLDPTLFLLHIDNMTFLMMLSVILLSMQADDTTLYSKCDQASDLCQQLGLASQLASDLQDTVDWGRKKLVSFNSGKTQLVLFDWSNNIGGFDIIIDGSALDKKSSFKMLRLTFSLKLNWDFTLSLFLKLFPRILEP